jgi:hypothetical protein
LRVAGSILGGCTSGIDIVAAVAVALAAVVALVDDEACSVSVDGVSVDVNRPKPLGTLSRCTDATSESELYVRDELASRLSVLDASLILGSGRCCILDGILLA